MADKTSHYHFKQRLHETVTSAQDINELMPMVNSLISVDKIKDLLHQQIELDEESAPKAYFNSLPMNQIFPDDIIQFILSFAGFYGPKGVSNKWNNHCIKNENIHIIKAHKVINNDNPTEITYNKETNNTWIVHPHIKKLHPLYKKWGYKGPISLNDTNLIFSDLACGDRLLICGSNNAASFGDDNIRIDKNLQIFGIGSNAIIKYSGRDIDSFLQIMEANVYIKNITFDFRDNFFSEGCIQVHQRSKLSLNNVKAYIGSFGISVQENASLNVINCEFIGGSSCIDMSPAANEVNINKCIFKNCGESNKDAEMGANGCIIIAEFYEEMIDHEINRDGFVTLNCVGNVFEDNMCYPICQLHPGGFGSLCVRCAPRICWNIDTKFINMTDNVLKGFNGTKVNNIDRIIDDANVLYFNNQFSTGVD
eukprot:186193_1